MTAAKMTVHNLNKSPENLMKALKKYRAGGRHFRIAKADTADKNGLPDSKAERKKLADELGVQLNQLQDILYGQEKHRILIVLQGMDTSGKDGTIRHVFAHTDPLGIRAAAFKVPTENERAHDYLWRVHQVVPQNGEIVVFNRSHYEDVLTTLVHGSIDEDEFQRRLEHINHFEKLLTDTGTTIIKCFLHISKDEQRKRLQERIDEPSKNWKFNPRDLDDRALWDDFQTTYQRVIQATDTDNAPWYVIPADSKSARNVIILKILLAHLKALDLHYPEADSASWPETID